MSPELSESTSTLPFTSSTRMLPELSCSTLTLPSTFAMWMSPELSSTTSTSPRTSSTSMSPELSRTRTLPARVDVDVARAVADVGEAGDPVDLEVARAVLQRERVQIFEDRVAARVGGFHRNVRRQRDADVDVGVFVVAERPAVLVLRQVGFDIDDVAFAPHDDLRRVEQLLLGARRPRRVPRCVRRCRGRRPSCRRRRCG